MTVVAEADAGEEALDKARAEHPDVVVMDILLPGMNGIDSARRIRAEQPDVRVLALYNHFVTTFCSSSLRIATSVA